MREKTIEQKLVQAVKAKGGIAPKFVSPGFSGVPDRLILLPDGKCGFVEVKAPGEKPRPLQKSRIRLLRGLGFLVFILDDESQIPHILSEIGGDAELSSYHMIISNMPSSTLKHTRSPPYCLIWVLARRQSR